MLTKRELSILEENGWLVTFSTPKIVFGVEEAKEEVVA